MADVDPASERIAIRRTVFFSGNVQGVSFRFSACQVARNFKIVGYVKNLFDGRVELVAEGLCDEVDGFIEAIEQAMKHYIERRSSTDSTALGDLASFAIAY